MCLDKVSCIFRIFIMITSLPQVERARADCSLQAGTGSAACRPILPPSCKDTPALVYLLFYNQLLFLHSIFPAHKCKTLPLILMTPIVPKKGNAKECSNYRTIALISYASKVMLKILQARLQHTWTMNFQMFKLLLEKAEEPDIKLPTSAGSLKKQESSRTSISALLAMPKLLTGWITTKCGKLFKR